MAQVVYWYFPTTIVSYKFINRGKDKFPQGFDILLKNEIKNLSKLKLTREEKEWLLKQKGIYSQFVDWFSTYQFDSNEVKIKLDKEGNLDIKIEGSWLRTIFWEVPLMAIISELYFEAIGYHKKIDSIAFICNAHIKRVELEGLNFADFGTRRRFSFEAQEVLVEILQEEEGNFLGTSNPYLAMKYHVNPIGTYAHEAVMAMQVAWPLEDINTIWLDLWRKIYGKEYDIMLTDTVSTNVFIQTVDELYWKLNSGVRLDSGDSLEIGDKIIQHYFNLGIDSKTKTLVFSDNLNSEKARKIYKYFKDKCKIVFGIGTNLTNDYRVKPLNMVIKLATVNGKGVIKLSDEEGKHTGKEDDIKQAIYSLTH
jgi:nicotinate phosphoribosyltransferase